jgi:hypothetical protein
VLSLCYAALHPKSVRNVTTVVTPVDFHADQHDGLDINDAHRPCDVRIGSFTSIPRCPPYFRLAGNFGHVGCLLIASQIRLHVPGGRPYRSKPVLRCDQSGCKSARCPPHFVHLSRGFTGKSFVVSRAPCAASSSNVSLA